VTDPDGEQSTYAQAGVDTEAAGHAVELIKQRVRSASRPEVVGDLGGFAGLFALDPAKYRRPLLASSTDGVGTKLVIAQQLGRHDTVGIDLVAMVVDDLVVYRDPGGSAHLFTGDSLFPGGPGKTVTPQDFSSLMDDLEVRVFGELPDDTWVYPGHGDDTTLGAERPQLPEWRARGW